MSNVLFAIRFCLLWFAVCVACSGCGSPPANQVVVYTALDEMYSRPILSEFEKQTGIKVRAVYDTEASKTTGLVTRLIAEKSRPRADAFWNNEPVQTIRLKAEGVLEAYRSPSAVPIPSKFKDPEGYWTGFAARGRVVIYNTNLVQEPPTSILDFADPKWSGKAAIALPLFGTTASHAAALFAFWGQDQAETWFKSLLANKVAVLPGNATVRDQVAQGKYAIGLTDTDDANGAIEDGLPAKWLFPDQGPDQMGTLILPNTVALIKGAPHTENGRKLIDFLLSPQVESSLAAMRSIQIPLNPSVEAPENVPKLSTVKMMEVSLEDMARMMPTSAEFIRREYMK